jgi:hypothetical protein
MRRSAKIFNRHCIMLHQVPFYDIFSETFAAHNYYFVFVVGKRNLDRF